MRARNGMFEKLERESKRSDEYQQLLDVLYGYFYISDLEYVSNRHLIFLDLYIEKKSNRAVSVDNHVSQSTLTRNIKQFEELAQKIIKTDERWRNLREELDKLYNYSI